MMLKRENGMLRSFLPSLVAEHWEPGDGHEDHARDEDHDDHANYDHDFDDHDHDHQQ